VVNVSVTRVTGRFPAAEQTSGHQGGAMQINWRKDIDQALKDAQSQNRHVLLDFSAAPM